MCKPKGSMVEGCIFDGALRLYTKYMEAFTATKRCVGDANEEEGVVREVLDGVPKARELNMNSQNITHLYVCENHATILP